MEGKSAGPHNGTGQCDNYHNCCEKRALSSVNAAGCNAVLVLGCNERHTAAQSREVLTNRRLVSAEWVTLLATDPSNRDGPLMLRLPMARIP
jgi:hypothetical protein